MRIQIAYLLTLCLFFGLSIRPFGYVGESGAGNYTSPRYALMNDVSSQAPFGNLKISAESNSVPQSAGACNGVQPSWNLKVTIDEVGGVGVTVSEIRLSFYDNNLNQVYAEARSSAAFAIAFSGCGPGSNHVAANSRVCGSLCVHINGRQSGLMTLSLIAKDDNGNNASVCSGPITLLGPPRTQGADLSITNTSSTSEVARGKSLLYMVKVTNAGPETATGVTVTDSVDSGFTLNAVAVSQGSFTAPSMNATGAITWSAGSIPAGSSATAWIVLNVTSTASAFTRLSNTARVTATSVDPNPDDNVAREDVTLTGVDARFKTDLTVTSTSSPENAAPGKQVVYNVNIRNGGPDPASSLTLIDILPVGTTFSSLVTSPNPGGQTLLPRPGTGGAVISTFSLGVNQTMTLTIKANVVTASGSSLVNKATLIEGGRTEKLSAGLCITTLPLGVFSEDPNPGDNLALDGRSVRGGGIVKLSWEQPPSTVSDPTPAPRNLRVGPGDSALANAAVYPERDVLTDRPVSPQAVCVLLGYNIYTSGQGVVSLDPSNLVLSVPPPTSQGGLVNTNAPVAPEGSSYVVTAVWRCSVSEAESKPSNQVGVPAGPAMESAEVGSTVKLKGSGFVDPVEILIDGIGFKKEAKVKSAGKQVLQKGKLDNGKLPGDLVGPGKNPLLSIRNGNGGISSVRLSQ